MKKWNHKEPVYSVGLYFLNIPGAYRRGLIQNQTPEQKEGLLCGRPFAVVASA